MTFEQFLDEKLIPSVINIAFRLIAAALILAVGTMIIKYALKKIRTGRLVQRADKTVHSFIVSFVKISLYALLAVITVAALGINMASIVAVIGSAGLAVSLAVQGTLSNLASGITILVFKPFREGDYIEAAGEGGTVTDLGIFYTTLTTPDNKVVVIPNGSITSGVLTNYSAKDTRRVEVNLTLAHGTDLETVRKSSNELLFGSALVLRDPAPFVRMTELGGESIVMSIRAWCKSVDFWDLKFLLNETLYERLAEAGVQIPHSQLDVHIKENNQGEKK